MAKKLTKQEMINQVDPPPELVSLRTQLSSALHDVKALKTQVGNDEKLFAYVRDAIKVLPKYSKKPIPKPKLTHADVLPALILADAHSEEVVKPEEVEGLADYSWEVFEQRMKLTAEKCIELVTIMRQGSNIPNLDVWLLGDWFVGTIHPDDLGWGTSAPLPCALPAAARALADLLLRLSTHFEKMRVVGVVGNHGRTTIKPAQKMTADRNWDYALYLIAREFTARNQSIEWILPKSRIHIIDAMGHAVALTHGDVCRRTHTIPYFGIINSINKQARSRRGTDKEFDYAVMGHWHHQALLEGETFICPSLIGPSQYSQYEMHARKPAQQDILFWTERHGPTCRWPINL